LPAPTLRWPPVNEAPVKDAFADEPPEAPVPVDVAPGGPPW
jgi:hypothetical protein